jgi:hypothetical protein
MQGFPKRLDAEDRRIVRRWRLVSAGFYGSIVAALILYISFSQGRDVNYASVKPAASAGNMIAPR